MKELWRRFRYRLAYLIARDWIDDIERVSQGRYELLEMCYRLGVEKFATKVKNKLWDLPTMSDEEGEYDYVCMESLVDYIDNLVVEMKRNKMTKDEKLIISAYTGVLMTTMDELHQFIEQKLGRPVWTHELAHKSVTDEIKEAVKDDFLKLCDDGTNDMELKPCPFCGGTAELKDYTDKIYGFDDYEIRCQCGCIVRSQSTREHYFDGNRYCTPHTEEAKSRALKGLIKLWNEGGK